MFKRYSAGQQSLGVLIFFVIAVGSGYVLSTPRLFPLKDQVLLAQNVSEASIAGSITDSILPAFDTPNPFVPKTAVEMQVRRTNPLPAKNLSKSYVANDALIERVAQAVIKERFQFFEGDRPNAWVLSQMRRADAEELLDYSHLFFNSISWGTARHLNVVDYQWFSHTDIDGVLHLKLSWRVDKKSVGPFQVEYLSSGITHLWRTVPANWEKEFCYQLSETDPKVCDKAGAFEKYFLKDLKTALPELVFKTVGVFPR